MRYNAAVMESPDLFSVPRRFDLATLLVVTTAYALLFAAMRLLNFYLPAFVAIGGLFTFVAICQALLFGGDKPREASAIGGLIYWTFWLVALISVDAAHGQTGWLICIGVPIVLSGIVTGYLSGVLVGGVFLVAHYLRGSIGWLGRQTAEDENGQSPWEDDRG